MRKPWSIEDEQYLRENYPVKPTRDLCEPLVRTEKAVRSRAKLLGLVKTGDLARRPWTGEEDQYLVEHYLDELTDNIARTLGRARCSIYGRAQKLGLGKSESFRISEFSGRLNVNQGKPFRFKKGHTPANKGKKMSPEQYEVCKGTMFKKGDIPKNHQPVGTIALRNNYKRDTRYLYIKVAEPNQWELLQRHLWEKEHGHIPEDMMVVFKDGNTKNCTLENLEMITKAENMKRNTIHNRYPEELKKAIITLGALKRKIREHEKHN